MTNKIRARHQFKRGNDDCKEHVEKAADFYAKAVIKMIIEGKLKFDPESNDQINRVEGGWQVPSSYTIFAVSIWLEKLR
ncbi:MAG: hypothetical protein WBI02_10930 [Tepidanaerobacteraceae bacterium]|jgi:hypothetical protein